jgi:hypothetical protein
MVAHESGPSFAPHLIHSLPRPGVLAGSSYCARRSRVLHLGVARIHPLILCVCWERRAEKMADPRQMWENLQKGLARAQQTGQRLVYPRPMG